MAAQEIQRFGITPKAALLSHSNFGSSNQPTAVKMGRALQILQETAPWLEVDGEDLFHERYYPDPSLPPGDIIVQTVHHGFDDPWLSATRAHQVAITGAKDRVLIQTPYFVPDPETMQAITNAAAGGVRVVRE